MRCKRFIAFFPLFAVLFAASAFAQRDLGARPTETGGPLLPEQAAFDVMTYDVSVRVEPKSHWISGTTVMTAKATQPVSRIVLHLDQAMKIERLYSGADDRQSALKYQHKDGKIWIDMPRPLRAGQAFEIITVYSGKPRVAPRPPWVGGFMWEKTPAGADWVSVALQNDGSDLYFPIKDHPSDKADSVTMRLTVPDPLVAAGPGKLEETKKNSDGTSTYVWRMTNPIPNYSIVFNAAPYRVIKDSVKSITGETIPIEFYVLPESYAKGQDIIDQTKKFNAFFEKYLGPFPWRSQKLGIVETPHLGMEHSTLIAYGNKFQNNEHGFDWLMLHEYGHEWWANLVTARDWKDFWIHEGFQSFMDTLYLEHIGKPDAYFAAMRDRAKRTRNMQPVAPREAKFAYEVYLAAPDYVKSDGDIYGKGAVVLHTLRYLIGDDAFFRALRRMSYPTPAMERYTDGRQTRFVDTDDFLRIAEQESKMDLDWFFEVYLRQPKLPKLIVSPAACTESTGTAEKSCKTELRWETPNNMNFPMPVEVTADGKTQRIEMRGGRGSFTDKGGSPAIDPKGWILMSK